MNSYLNVLAVGVLAKRSTVRPEKESNYISNCNVFLKSLEKPNHRYQTLGRLFILVAIFLNFT